MAGSILQMARRDTRNIVNSGGFEEDIKLTSPTAVIANVKGRTTKHHQAIDNDGLLTNALTAYVGVMEDDLLDAGYPVRNSADQVDLYDHIVEVADSTGTVRRYTVKEQYPDEHLGIIVLHLGDASN